MFVKVRKVQEVRNIPKNSKKGFLEIAFRPKMKLEFF